MTKIITCSELRYRKAGELQVLLRALQSELDRTATYSPERRMVLSNLEVVHRALAACLARQTKPGATP
jgi:hypothetical protein